MIINKKEFNENYRDQLLFINFNCGGLGNFFGGFFSAMDFYYMYKLNITHKFVCISNAHVCGDVSITDFFTFNDNIILLNNNKEEKEFGINYPDNMVKLPHPYNHINECPPLDIKIKSVFYSNNFICVNDLNNIILAKKYFKIELLENIKQKISFFVKDNNINKNTLGIHYRGTDGESQHAVNNTKIKFFNNLSNKINNYKTYFICSDDSSMENYLVTKLNGIVYKKNTNVVKIPGFENCEWRLNAHEQRLLYDKYKINCEFNVYRSLNHCIDGFIDAAILGHCDIVSNIYSSFDTLGIFIYNLYFSDR